MKTTRTILLAGAGLFFPSCAEQVGEANSSNIISGDATENLVLHYDFEAIDASGNLIDLTSGENSGAVYGATPTTEGVRGGAYYFDGSADVVEGANLGELPSGTVSFWISADDMNSFPRNAFSSRRNRAGCHDDCFRCEHYQHIDNGNGFGGFTCSAVGLVPPHERTNSLMTRTLTKGEWNHVAFSWDKHTFRTYFNGEMRYSERLTSQINTNFENVAFGNGYAQNVSRDWRGTIDEARIYDRALNADEVRALYLRDQPCGNGQLNLGETCDDMNLRAGDGCSSTCTIEPSFSCIGAPSVCAAGIDKDLLLRYDFETVGGTGDLVDLASGAYPGAVLGAMSVGGVRGAGLSFDPAALGHVAVGDLGFVAEGSASYWINSNEIEAPRATFSTVANWDNGIRCEVTASADGNGLACSALGLPGPAKLPRVVERLNTGRWLHVVVTWDESTFTAYANGSKALVSPTTTTYSGWLGTRTLNRRLLEVSFGRGYSRHSPKRHWNGVIDEARIYSKKLTDRQVRYLFELDRPR